MELKKKHTQKLVKESDLIIFNYLNTNHTFSIDTYIIRVRFTFGSINNFVLQLIIGTGM